MQDFITEMEIERAENSLAQKLLVAFTAEVGCKPSEAEIYRQVKPNGDVVIAIRKRDSAPVIQIARKTT